MLPLRKNPVWMQGIRLRRMQSAPYNVALMLKGGEDLSVEGYNPFDEISA